MGKFLTGDHLNSELVKIFESAGEDIIIVSPFIKLHARIKDCLKDKFSQPKVKITIVFGKNENKKSKSLSLEEFEFLREFPNIEIKYESRLHAKYYANESYALLSSMNLYDYSQNNNIEFGILTKTTLLGGITGNIVGDSLDEDAYNFFEKLMANSEVKYQRVPIFENKLMGITKKYMNSETLVDKLTSELGIKINIAEKVACNKKQDNQQSGFCIRTGVSISFNPNKPFSDLAFKSWNKFKEKDYPEKYCHYSGEKSNGETSFSKPILRKNWKKSQG